jgi:hypothetical protein
MLYEGAVTIIGSGPERIFNSLLLERRNVDVRQSAPNRKRKCTVLGQGEEVPCQRYTLFDQEHDGSEPALSDNRLIN